jgi:hypothetical protein
MRKENKWKVVLTETIALLGGLAVGGLFVGKTTTGFAVLNYVPAPVHPIVGWIIIGATAIFGGMALWKAVTK